MKKYGQSDFSKGVCNGLPVALGYIPLSFSFGTIAISGGYNFIVPTIMSMLSFTGAGQMAGIQMMIQAASLVSIFFGKPCHQRKISCYVTFYEQQNYRRYVFWQTYVYCIWYD